MSEKRAEIKYCPIIESTADGDLVGRCWFYLYDGKTCERHGDVSEAVEHYKITGDLTPEYLCQYC